MHGLTVERVAENTPWLQGIMTRAKFRLKTTPVLAAEMGVSDKAIRALRQAGAPFLAQKSHPELLFEWMKRYPEKIPTKVT